MMSSKDGKSNFNVSLSRAHSSILWPVYIFASVYLSNATAQVHSYLITLLSIDFSKGCGPRNADEAPSREGQNFCELAMVLSPLPPLLPHLWRRDTVGSDPMPTPILSR